jgi:hypothetical protein
MTDTVQLGSAQDLQARIAAAHARQAQIEAEARATTNQPQVDQFTFLVNKLFGDGAIETLGARVEWRERPALVIPWNGHEYELVALPKPTGHVGWRVGTIELFEQKYAPSQADALDLLLVALDVA